MNRSELKAALTGFLSSDSNQKVLLIKGDWGIGKSYFVNEIASEWARTHEENVAITSLFGCTDFNQCIPRIRYLNSPKKSILNKVVSTTKGLAQSISLPHVNVDLTEALKWGQSFLLKDILLIFDDVERKDRGLSLRSILSQVSYLSEKTLKKAVIVLSEQGFDEKDRADLKELREKVLDAEYHFMPSARDNASIIINSKHGDRIKIIEELNLTNIRIIQKIDVAWKILIDGYDVHHDAVKISLLRTIAILSIVHYSDKFKEHDLEDIPKVFRSLERDSDLLKRLRDMGYGYFDERDLPIFDFVRTSRVNEKQWHESIQSLQDDHQAQEIREKFKSVLKVFNGNFKNDSEKVSSDIASFLNEYAESISPQEIVQIFEIFDAIGYDYTKSNWLKRAIEKNGVGMDISALRKRGDKVVNADLSPVLDEIEKKQTEKTQTTLPDAIRQIVKNNGWSDKETSTLRNATVSDYKNWFANSDESDLLPLVRDAYRMFSQPSWDKVYKDAAENIYAAAKELASDPNLSEEARRLNAYRMKIFFDNH